MTSPSEHIRVLVVDDHPMVRRGLATFLKVFDDLELAGEAAHGEAAIQLCAELQPDVVLMDMVMPDMDGATATRHIRSRSHTIQVIALTSFKEESLVQSALQAGAIGYLLKDVSAEELAQAIRAAHAGRTTLSPEAAQALVHAASQSSTAGTGPDRARAGRAGPDGGGIEQHADRRQSDRQPVHRQVPRQQHPDQTGRRQPHRGGDPGAAHASGRLNPHPPSPKWRRRTLPGRWMWPGSLCCTIGV